MAEKKFAEITRATVIAECIDMFREMEQTEQVEYKIDVLTRMLASITKKSNAPKQPSKAAMENAKLATKVLEVMPNGETVLTSWIMEHVNGIMTPQKCTKVMQVLIESGKVEKVEKVKGRYTGYQLV